MRRSSLVLLASLLLAACGSSGSGNGGVGGSGGHGGFAGGGPVTPPPASCAAASGGGSKTVGTPTLLMALKDRWEEAWLGSPSVADLDGDGKMEIVVPRGETVIAWQADGALRWKFTGAAGRVWASAIVADFTGDARLEVAFAARDQVFLLDSDGNALPGFPVSWDDELRALAAGDLDGDGSLDLVVSTGHGSPTDVVAAWHVDGSPVDGFPPNATGKGGCTMSGNGQNCYLAGCYDQNLAVGDLDGDGKADVIAPHDNAYASFHHGSGAAFDAAPGFSSDKTPGVRYLHDLAEAQQGYSDHEATSLQAHFTNTAPAIADLDGDTQPDVLMLASVQNASQDDRLKGVAVWALQSDASRLAGWETPLQEPNYLSGLWDYGETNVVAITNQLSVADLDPTRPGPELVFAGFDGRVHAVSAAHEELWSYTYTTSDVVATGGVVIGDLSGDGSPEIVFATYSTDSDVSALYGLDAGGNELFKLALPTRGAMPVPTLADVNGDGTVEIVVSLKDAADNVESVRIYTVPGSAENCLLWPTGRGNALRSGWAR